MLTSLTQSAPKLVSIVLFQNFRCNVLIWTTNSDLEIRHQKQAPTAWFWKKNINTFEEIRYLPTKEVDSFQITCRVSILTYNATLQARFEQIIILKVQSPKSQRLYYGKQSKKGNQNFKIKPVQPRNIQK